MDEEPEYAELEVTCFVPSTVTKTCRITKVEELDDQLGPLADERLLCVGLTRYFEGNTPDGSFWLFLKEDRAWIHLIDGPCITAHDPNFDEISEGVVEFVDDVDVIHRIPLQNTISREQGLQALRYWLPQRGKLPILTWCKA